MPPHGPALLVQKVPGGERRPQVGFEKAAVIPAGNEADILAVLPPGIGKAQGLRQLPDLPLLHAPQGKPDPGQLPLAQGIEEIALVLPGVQGLFQKPAARLRVPVHPGVMPGSHVIEPRRLRRLHQPGELHAAVAVHTGIGGPSGLVDLDKFLNHGLLKLPGQLHRRKGNAQLPADGLRVGGVPAIV